MAPNNFGKQQLIYGTNQIAGFQAVQQVEMLPNQICIFVDSTATEIPRIFFKSTNEYGMTKNLIAYECNDITAKLMQGLQNGGFDPSKYPTRDEIYDIVTKAINDSIGGKTNESNAK